MFISEAMAQGASQKVALENLEKGLILARRISAEEHKKYEAAKHQLKNKNRKSPETPKLHVTRALTSSVWHKHKTKKHRKGKHFSTKAHAKNTNIRNLPDNISIALSRCSSHRKEG